MKKFLRILLIVILAIVIAVGGLLLYLTITEYKPEAVEYLPTAYLGESETPGETISVLSWNVGYCGLGKDADFVMDGGKGDGKPESKGEFDGYFEGVRKALEEQDADIYLLQEVDVNSSRSYGLDETSALPQALNMHSTAFALNYSCDFVPFPLPPIGKVNGGVLTMTDFAIEDGSAERIALPCPFSWPLRVANLKRCLLASRIDLPDSDKELVVVNLHLEAYDSGEGKAAQTAMLVDFIETEYEKGNYVIAGGDFNQTFPGGLDAFPMQREGLWTPGTLTAADLPEGFSFVYDTALPSCRSLDRPLDSTDPNFQYYLIDGFILSPNVEQVSVKTQDLGFQYSDHNPVRL
ncbi:MAG: endonuclease, partial [Oscillospiraceae bacterium]